MIAVVIGIFCIAVGLWTRDIPFTLLAIAYTWQSVALWGMKRMLKVFRILQAPPPTEKVEHEHTWVPLSEVGKPRRWVCATCPATREEEQPPVQDR